MQISWCFIATLLSGSALADYPAGPYATWDLCYKSCAEIKQCGNSNHVVCYTCIVIYTAITAALLFVADLPSDHSLSALSSKHVLIITKINCAAVPGEDLFSWVRDAPCGHCKGGKFIDIYLRT